MATLTNEQAEKAIREKKYLFQHTQAADLPGEIWKMIPWCDDAYMLSNYGRVKSLPREVLRKDGITIRLPGGIKKTLVHRMVSDSKHHPGQVMYSVVNAVNIDGKKYRFGIARYLYYLFVEEYDMDDFNLKVCHKDENRLNLSLDNLGLVPYADVMRKSYRDGVRKREGWMHKARKIIQHTIEGEYIGEYVSIQLASIATGIDHASIYRTVTGEYKQYKGFVFKEAI